jgi:hypothetical protein
MTNEEADAIQPENTTVETTHHKPNHTRTHLFIFSFTIFKKNSTKNGSKSLGFENPPGMRWDNSPEETPEQTSLYGNRIHIPLLKDIPIRLLYFIASSCLLLIFLMIIKLILARRGKKDYSLVTKGDFDA